MPATITTRDGKTLVYREAHSMRLGSEWLSLQRHDGTTLANLRMSEVLRYGFEEPAIKPPRRQKARRT